MRAIKFRGMSEITGHEWVYGNLHIDYKSGDMWVGEEAPYEPIIRETVGQFTGLKDCNGQEIYEGDILYLRVDDRRYEVVWNKCAWELRRKETSILMANLCNAPDGFVFKVVGNIYDNPELWEGRKI